MLAQKRVLNNKDWTCQQEARTQWPMMEIPKQQLWCCGAETPPL